MANYTHCKESNKQKRFKNMIKGYIDSRSRQAFSRWKELYYQETQTTFNDLQDTNFHSGENSNIKRR